MDYDEYVRDPLNARGRDRTVTPPPAETPRTAADVLDEHQLTGGATGCDGGWLLGCTCGAEVETLWDRDGADWDRPFAQHQATALASAGLLATPTYPTDFVRFVAPGHEQKFADWLAEHDREVVAQERQNIVVRLAEMAANYKHDDLPDEHPTACIYEVLTDAADRIAAREGS